MRRFLSLLLILVFALALRPGVAAGATQIQGLEVVLQDNVVARQVTYKVRFTPTTTLMGGQDSIYFTFPAAVPIESGINRYNVSVNGTDADSVALYNNTLTVRIPFSINIATGNQVEVAIASSVIKNPATTGYYQVKAYTSRDTQEVVSPSFFITDYEYPNGVSKPTVTLSNTVADQTARYQISFKTSPNGRLVGGSDSIYITFPSYTTMPSSLYGSYVSINGTTLNGQYLAMNGRKVTLPVPSGMTIAAGAAVEVVFALEAGIKNPPASDYNVLIVSTTAEPREIYSLPYQLGEASSQEQEAAKEIRVTPSPDGQGQPAGYTITVKEGSLSGLGADLDGLVLAFPSGTVIPAEIPAQYIRINGYPAAGVLVNSAKNEIIFTINPTVPTKNAIIITIDKNAGFCNPSSASHKLVINSLRSGKTIFSDPFEIKLQNSTTTTTTSNTTTTGGTGSTAGSGGGTATASGTIVLYVDSLLAQVDGVTRVLDAAPVIVDNVTMVPLRFISDSLGATTEYNSAGQYVTIKYGTKEMNLWVDSILAKVDGSFTSIQTPVRIINDRMMVPIRFISENFGATVTWDGTARSIKITRGAAAGTANTSTNTSTTPVATDTYPIGYKAYVKPEHSYVNVRSGPDTSYAQAGKILQGQYATVLGVDGDWYRVRLTSGQEAWVANWVVDVPR